MGGGAIDGRMWVGIEQTLPGRLERESSTGWVLNTTLSSPNSCKSSVIELMTCGPTVTPFEHKNVPFTPFLYNGHTYLQG
jgi:hypothetical protein